ncbi:class I SAM-dependent methyltransferase [Vitreoscilla stercoraria]|uniref:Class I SAM-dependent methyltransferase n=1 Tax=Vitreoscilla stercoraria TaxID=61 RepID=A0ABY4EBJ5_VITST|nr:class I SAM-dependent methyltransferase [Vitreoscilla stercoraria]UOO92599.1 class I SAM-dependent methyltransferase [Vitreoscilla stercoraria]
MMEQDWKSLGLDARLAWVASQVRSDVCVIDVGTDHARLPIALVQSGKTQQAIAADVAKQPLQQAQIHIAAANLSAQISTILSDGLAQIKLPEQADITICGMGGDTIVRMMQAQASLKQAGVRLILQPQTEIAALRQYLAQQGFEVEAETILAAEGRIYQALVVQFTGRPYSLSLMEAELGSINLAQRSEVLLQYVRKRQAVVKKWQQAKFKAGQDAAWETEFILLYQQILQSS